MTRPRLLDLFCGGGGCSVGYARAGWDVEGVDLVRQPDYPFPFHLGDALRFSLDGYDAVHASPPCKAHSSITQMAITKQPSPQLFDPRPDLLVPMIERLREWGGLWIVENVPRAPMPPDAVTYCGSSFGLMVRRHRLFAASVPLAAPPCEHDRQPYVVGVYGDGGVQSSGMRPFIKARGGFAAAAMEVDWTHDQKRLSQMIPPAYAEHAGRQLLAALDERKAPT